MKNQISKFEEFKIEKLSKSQQKAIQGGDDPVDPSKGNGKGNGVI
ncbi:rSAM-modified peptide [Flavobacterium piscisymbiosum]|uniref:RSAM-modified peptide n=1 Tax=Flavobacterium piscisymbiosum TaxID=2893753 RepID=A0ABS8MB57_9FLAO|nr:rSAM-modified peptide [Flavobacterium sp. F-30]MCC9062762.1 rSAM-modified peptide [Flavobacterium sp. F-30]